MTFDTKRIVVIFLVIVFSMTIIIISLFVPIETFLVDDIKHILDTDPPCLLTDKMVKRLGNNYCSILTHVLTCIRLDSFLLFAI